MREEMIDEILLSSNKENLQRLTTNELQKINDTLYNM